MSDAKAVKGSKLKITHAQSDAKYLKQEKLLLLRPDLGREDKLLCMNDGKVWYPYWYRVTTSNRLQSSGISTKSYTRSALDTPTPR